MSEGAGEVVLNLTANGTSAVNYTVVVDTRNGSATGEQWSVFSWSVLWDCLIIVISIVSVVNHFL